MKAKLLESITIIDNEEIPVNTEVEIVDNYCGYYICKIPNGRHIIINSDLLKIIDYAPSINWEQRRYEIAKEIMAHTDGGYHVKHDAIEAVRGADALIAELKKK